MCVQKDTLTELVGAAILFLSNIKLFPTISLILIHTFPPCDTSSKDLHYTPQLSFL